jgi:hypothetical protein
MAEQDAGGHEQEIVEENALPLVDNEQDHFLPIAS